jgi:di/tricarboxylate transporter
MNFESILVCIVIAFILISLYKEIVGPAFTFVIGIAVLGVFQILTPSEILSGFANDQIAIIIMLLILGDIFRQTSILDIVFDKLFQKVSSYVVFRRRMVLVVATFSAFLNNTPLVALMMPYVHSWSKRNKISSSKLLMPLSYAAILGGCATLIGTSTNMIVNGLVIDQTIIPNLKPLGIFDFSYVGIPMIFVGFIYMATIGSKLLPSNTDPIEKLEQNAREYIVEVEVKEGCEYIGKSIHSIDFETNRGLSLYEIIRKDGRNIPPTPNIIIFEGDTLIFTGNTKNIAELISSNPSLVIPSVGMFSRKKLTEIVEVVVSHNSQLIDKKVKYENFRRKYDATVIAIHRNGETLSGKIDDIELKAGDALLLLSGKEFESSIVKTNDIYSISSVKQIHRIGVLRTAVLAAGAPLIFLLSALGVIKLFNGLLVLLIVSLLLKISSPKDIVKSIDFGLALIIALSLALGTAMIKTGVAEAFANGIIKLLIPFGKVGILTGLYFITALLAAFITNKAAVAIIFPISLTTAVKLALNPMPFILVVSFAAAANFMTPIGYQTNLMVYGPGGYNFKDFLRVGSPLTFLYMVVTVVILSYQFF